ncbi:hypothetical protein BVI2075_320242 [Burkholderia vietnamiensis]|nr:hypothetical protein BVI1335_120043 [Burkholderia vietnamiensis]CAG9203422.1 hypothetical protein BVI2075_320242 [Burkholderia vietnamiensis]
MPSLSLEPRGLSGEWTESQPAHRSPFDAGRRALW